MEKELSILSIFFDDPLRDFHLREVSRIIKINHMTARAYLNRFVKGGFLLRKESGIYVSYTANTESKTFRNLKLYFNLETLRKSKIIDDLEQFYEYPPIILFGSCASAINVKESDIDLCIISNIQREFKTEKYHPALKRKVSLHKFTEKEWSKAKQKNPEFINSICNGITLSGKLEVV